MGVVWQLNSSNRNRSSISRANRREDWISTRVFCKVEGIIRIAFIHIYYCREEKGRHCRGVGEYEF